MMRFAGSKKGNISQATPVAAVTAATACAYPAGIQADFDRRSDGPGVSWLTS